MATLLDKRTRNVYDDVIGRKAPPPNLKTANISGYMVCILSFLLLALGDQLLLRKEHGVTARYLAHQKKKLLMRASCANHPI